MSDMIYTSFPEGVWLRKGEPSFLLWEPETPDNRQRQLRDETSLAVTNPRISAWSAVAIKVAPPQGVLLLLKNLPCKRDGQLFSYWHFQTYQQLSEIQPFEQATLDVAIFFSLSSFQFCWYLDFEKGTCIFNWFLFEIIESLMAGHLWPCIFAPWTFAVRQLCQ